MKSDEPQVKRCPRHDLALDTRGECVRCQRERKSRERSSQTSADARRVIMLLVFLGILALFGSYDLYELVVQWTTDMETPSTRASGSGSSSLAAGVSSSPQRAASPGKGEERVAGTDGGISDVTDAGKQPDAGSPGLSTPPAKDIGAVAARSQEESGLKAARRKVEVRMYSGASCLGCGLARDYMIERGISFREMEASQDPVAKAMWISAGGSKPVFKVDNYFVTGFDPETLERTIDIAARDRR